MTSSLLDTAIETQMQLNANALFIIITSTIIAIDIQMHLNAVRVFMIRGLLNLVPNFN